MKKMLSLILALVLLLSLAVPAFAETNDGNKQTNIGGNTNIDVKAKYNSSSATSEKISVDIAWGAMEFTYNVGGTKEWNAATHQYVDNTTKNWTATGNTVTVTNHSNVAVNATLSFAKEANYSTVNGSFDKPTLNLATAVDTAVADAPKDTATLTLDGTLGDTVTTLTKIGTITVAIAATTAAN